MPKFSINSKAKLSECDPKLQQLFEEVIKSFDCTIICSFRNKKDQDDAVIKGNSKTNWPTSKHNKVPSMAVDVMPCPVNWSETIKNIEQITLFAGFVLGTAAQMGIKIRWGHDWNRDMHPDEKMLVDRPHYELMEE
jgi:peptidoglycan L-alanyl-D-glutamate endopeptidase CwlK